MMPGGQEHRVRDLSPFYLKATYPSQYGFTVVAGPVYPGLCQALPLEYLERLELGNAFFGDDWRLEAVGREGEKLVVFTSQTTVVGEAASPEEIIAFMERRRIALLNGVALGIRVKLRFSPFNHGLSGRHAAEHEGVPVFHQPFHLLSLLYLRSLRQCCGEVHVIRLGRAPLDPLNFDFMSHFFFFYVDFRLTYQ